MDYLQDLPISYDPVSKKVSLTEGTDPKEWQELLLEVEQLNTITTDLINSKVDIPPPPTPQTFTKQLSGMIKKMHESAVASMRQKKFPDATKQFTVALGLATARAKFESFQGALSEIVMCLLGRCDAYVMQQQFENAYGDAEILCQLAANIPDNHLRFGICQARLGNFTDAKTSFERGLSFNENHEKLKTELEAIKKIIAFEEGEM